MENICGTFYKSGSLTEEDEEKLVDYLYDNKIQVKITFPREKLCDRVLLHKLGSRTKVKEFKENLFKEPESITESDESKFYGDLSIDNFLNVALRSDDETLLKMIQVSKIHHDKFTDGFFKKYLELHYPNTLKFRPIGKTYKQYYLELIYAIDKLKRDHNFSYFPEETYDVLQTYRDAERIQPWLLKKYLDRVKLSNI